MANIVYKADKAVDVIKKGIDVFSKLRESFKISKETRESSKQCQEEIKGLKFKSFKETSSCKCAKGIPKENFGEFTSRLQTRFKFPDEIKESILDGLYAAENKEVVKDFRFKDGKGDIHHARFVTVKKGNEIDLAYAVYSLSFELSEKEIENTSLSWFLYMIPWQEVVITKEPQKLNDKEMDKFSQWCLVKLYDRVQE